MKAINAALRMSAVALAACCVIDAQAQENREQPSKVTADQDGMLHIPAHEVPLSSYMSNETRAFYKGMNQLQSWDAFNDALVKRARVIYPVRIEERKIAGVRTDVVTPKQGVAKQNQERVLINLHGGSFFCERTLQLIESIPIASTAKIRVISVDYRCAPKDKLHAAMEDIAAVYKELLKRYAPQNIGIYGCSAGGILTAESVAWFQKQGLPRPGAIGLFCGADAVAGGDSQYISAPIGSEIPPPEPKPVPIPEDSFFAGVDLKGPLVSPTLHPELLAQFPATLLITATRDFLASSVIYAHTQLVKAGVDAELHVWEGMDHCFLFYIDLPESKEMYDVTAKFFNAHLGKSHKDSRAQTQGRSAYYVDDLSQRSANWRQ